HLICAAVFMVQYHGQLLTGNEVSQSHYVDGIVFLYFVVILLVVKSKGQHTLFFQVGFVYTGKALYYNRTYTQVARFHSGVLTRATFTIVLITYYHAAYVSCFVYTLYGR